MPSIYHCSQQTDKIVACWRNYTKLFDILKAATANVLRHQTAGKCSSHALYDLITSNLRISDICEADKRNSKSCDCKSSAPSKWTQNPHLVNFQPYFRLQGKKDNWPCKLAGRQVPCPSYDQHPPFVVSSVLTAEVKWTGWKAPSEIPAPLEEPAGITRLRNSHELHCPAHLEEHAGFPKAFHSDLSKLKPWCS